MTLSLNCLAKRRGDFHKEKHQMGKCDLNVLPNSLHLYLKDVRKLEGRIQTLVRKFHVLVVVWVTDPSKQSGLTSGNEKC